MTPEPTTRQDVKVADSSLLADAEAHQDEICTCTTAGATVAANRSSAPLYAVSAFVFSSPAARTHAVRQRTIRNRCMFPPTVDAAFPSSIPRNAGQVRRRYAPVVFRPQ